MKKLNNTSPPQNKESVYLYVVGTKRKWSNSEFYDLNFISDLQSDGKSIVAFRECKGKHFFSRRYDVMNFHIAALYNDIVLPSQSLKLNWNYFLVYKSEVIYCDPHFISKWRQIIKDAIIPMDKESREAREKSKSIAK